MSNGEGYSGIEPVTAPGIHDDSGFQGAGKAALPSPQQFAKWGKEFIEGLLRQVVKAVTGVFFPGVDAFSQLKNWADDIGDFISNLVDRIRDALNDLLGAIFGGVNFHSLPTPGEFWDNLFGGGTINPGAIGQNIVDGLEGALGGLQNSVTNVVKGLFNGWFGGGATGSVSEVEAVANAIRESVFGEETVYTLTGTGNFIVPSKTIFIVAVTNGGHGGQAGAQTTTDNAPGGAGGDHGGWIVRRFTAADLGGVGASIPYQTGAAGGGGLGANYANGAAGGETRFGPAGSAFVVGQAGVSAYEAEGAFLLTSSMPGKGGQGGGFSSSSGVYSGQDGGATPLADGGIHGTTIGAWGGNGAAASVDRTPAGGGGGAGGNGNSGLFNPAGRGGNGGNYGAGGGGGGSCSNSGNRGNGGNGSPGAIYVIAK